MSRHRDPKPNGSNYSTREELHTALDAFLDDRVESVGGRFARFERDDLSEMYKIFYAIVCHKCDHDDEGDRPLEINIINKLTHQAVWPASVVRKGSWREDWNRPVAETLAGKQGTRIDQLSTLIAWASREIEIEVRQLRERSREQEPDA